MHCGCWPILIFLTGAELGCSLPSSSSVTNLRMYLRWRSAVMVAAVAVGACVHARTPPASCPNLMPETAASHPRWLQGKQLLGPASDSAAVTIHVVRAVDQLSLSDALVMIGEASGSARAQTNSTGYASVRVPSGRFSVLVLRVGYKRYVDTVSIRSRFADTLVLGLGGMAACLEI